MSSEGALLWALLATFIGEFSGSELNWAKLAGLQVARLRAADCLSDRMEGVVMRRVTDSAGELATSLRSFAKKKKLFNVA